ncbi:flocculation protein FLO11-like [Nicotiana tomentosiformis]|uniref:flocculation protein FLO11-like n=1 Tax=Nicotiana tomentosiformis TaxID=4098 RepID=UPI00388C491A
MEPRDYLEKLALKEEAGSWLAEILALGPTPSLIATGVPILRSTLSFESKGWQTFVCNRLDPCQNENNLPIPRAILVASIIAGYSINVGDLMSANIFLVAQQSNTSYPYPSTTTEYLTDAKVEPMTFDTKVKPTGPFEWYKLQDPRNPKRSAQPSTTTSHSDEQVVVVFGPSYIPSTSAETSTSASSTMPEPPSSAPSTTPFTASMVVPTPVPRSVPMPTGPLSAPQASQTLASLNNWMHAATSKLSEISSAVVGQASTQAPQDPSEINEKLSKILETRR